MQNIKFMFPRLMVPKNLCFKSGSLAVLKGLSAKKVMLVTGSAAVKNSGVLNKAVDYLKAGGTDEVTVYDKVAVEPDWELIKSAADAAMSVNPDWIIGFGGGAVMDAAKMTYALYENPLQDVDSILRPFSMLELRKKSKLILIPTTSGSGSEVSSSAAICNNVKKIKQIIVSHELMPDIAIIDPMVTLSLPKRLTALGGIDALTHAVEAFVSIAHNSFIDALAIQAVRLIMNHLVSAYETGNKLEHRECVHYAATLAGLAQNNVSVGITHSISHKLGALFKLPHGLLNGIFLVSIMKYNCEKCPERYEELAKGCGYQSIDNFMSAVLVMQKQIDLPVSLNHTGIANEQIAPILDQIANDVLADICTRTNPRKPSVNDIRSIVQLVVN